MNTFYIHILLNLTVLPATIAVAVRFRFIPRALYPFCLLLCIASINEIISLMLIHYGKSNSINGNCYILVEFLLLSLQFRRWQVLDKPRFFFCVPCGLLIWLLDNCFINSVSGNNSLSRIIFSLLYAFLCVDMINRHMVFDRGLPFKNSSFLLALGMLLFFACKAYVEVFNVLNLGFSTEFYARLWFALSMVNGASNIIFTIAILCIPRKQVFTMPSS